MRMFACKLIGFADAIGVPVDDMPVSGVLKARVKMIDEHDKLTGSKGEIVLTSALRSIDFERRLIVTQNNVYSFGGAVGAA